MDAAGIRDATKAGAAGLSHRFEPPRQSASCRGCRGLFCAGALTTEAGIVHIDAAIEALAHRDEPHRLVNRSGRLEGAIGFSGPDTRIKRKQLEDYSSHVVEAARRIGAELDGSSE